MITDVKLKNFAASLKGFYIPSEFELLLACQANSREQARSDSIYR